MSKFTALQREAILRRISDVPLQSVFKFIDNSELTLDECVENGLLINDIPINQFEKWIKQSLLDLDKLADLGLNLSLVEEIRKSIERSEELQENYDLINDDMMIIQDIQKHLRSGGVTEEGLLEKTTIDKELLNEIKGYEKKEHPSQNNDVALIKGTDIFFFGKASSGKTCVLASIFNYAEKEGLFIDNMVSIHGINYKNLIVNELKNSILPDSTPAEKKAVTYISTELILDGEANPLNFVEMSGEFFSKAAQDPKEIMNTIDAHGYLSNSNKKLLFFIVDYKMYSDNEKSSVSSQANDFNNLVGILDGYKKALQNAYCVYIVVNKSDKFPKGTVDKNEFAKSFFMKNFKSVYANLKQKEKKHNFDLRILHYSIGNLIFKNSYLSSINDDCPKNIIQSISQQAYRKNEDSVIGKFFKSKE